ncbi:AMP-dependent synthetase/ligase [Pelovirga terrestris]|uniref:AMP-binding protein n=1 Tax=Pelovirga terrestris TaxID=2771352 RepID=A0A8J6UGE6_9BACT|nr:AMP-binding protein [Pelovirga terrestris]MBD1399613.1 AMP-binding protein [Pelovirga terrestris]
MQKIDQIIQASCLKHSDLVAFKHKVNGQWKEISYGRFWNNVEKLTAGLQQLGIKEMSHVAILAPSSPRWVTSYLAILHAGCVAVPIDKELKAAELRHILGDADAQAIIVGQVQFDTLLEIIDDLPDLKNIILIDTPIEEMGDQDDIIETMQELKTLWQQLVADLNIAPERREPLEAAAQQLRQLVTSSPETSEKKKKERHFLSDAELIRNRLLKEKRLFSYKAIFADDPVVVGSTDADQRAVILYTSGTTGRSKGAMLSHRNIVSNIYGAQAHFKLDSSIATLSFLPINHVFEQVCGILLPLALGGRISFAESIKKLGDNLNEIKPTFLLGVPAVYRLLYDRIIKKIDSNTSSRMLFKFSLTRKIVAANVKKAVGEHTTFVSGGAALDPAISEGFRNLGLTLYQGYGITETSPVISAESPFKNQPGTVGECLQDVQVRIDNPNADGEGEILVKGPNVMLGYYNNPAATTEVLQEGWYRTGDLGRIDTNGMLSICGRVKNLIVTPNGKNVYPEEVENQLLKSPYIAEIMVYGHRIGKTAEEVYAVVFPDEEALFTLAREQKDKPLSAGEIENLIRREIQTYGKELADYKRVKKFTLREDEFPKTTTRKIKRYIVEPEISTN